MLRDLPPEVASSTPLVTWDDRIAAHRAVASDWPALSADLARQGLDATLPGRPAPLGHASRPPELRAYQRAALDAWSACGRRGIVVLPTGAGKTRVALAAIAACGVPALVLVPTRILMEQWVVALGSLGTAGGSRRDVGQLGDSRRSIEPLTVATYESAWRHAARLGDRFGLVVVDEAHHVGGALRTEALATSTARLRLGLTALPPRGHAAARSAELLGPVVFHLRVSELAGTALAPVRVVGIGLDLSPDERAEWLGETSAYRAERSRHALEAFGLPWDEAAAMLARTAAGRRALAARARARSLASFTAAKARVLDILLERHAADRVLVFTRDNATAYAIARAHLVPAVTCDIGRRERRETLAAFAAGDVRVLVSARVLDEGVDVPEASVAIIVGAEGSERQHVQRVGRILRPGPGKRAVVYDLFSLLTGEASLAARRRRAVAP